MAGGMFSSYRVLYQSDTAKGAVGPDQIFAFGKLVMHAKGTMHA
jgi:hypothetical protein